MSSDDEVADLGGSHEEEQQDLNEDAMDVDGDDADQSSTPNPKKRKLPFTEEESEAKRAKRAEQKEAKMKKKLMKPNAQLVADSLRLWESFRQRDCQKERRMTLIDQMLKLCKGKVMDIIFKSDACRVFEAVFKLGLLKHRERVYEELKDNIIELSTNHYGHHVVLKLLKYGSGEMKKHVMKQFFGKIVRLVKHRDASEVIERLFAEVADKTQKLSMLEEFWSPEFAIIKTHTPRKLDDILKEEPQRKASVVRYLHETIFTLLNRKDTSKAAAFTHSIVHEPILKYLQLASPKERSEMISNLAEHVVRFLHTKPGARAGVICCGFGSAKDRKTIAKSFKGYVDRICREENGHVVLLKLIECTDDTVLTGKGIYGEMKKTLLDLCNDKNGRYSIMLLLDPSRARRTFPVLNVELLKPDMVPDAEDPTKMVPTSKKDAEKRRSELLESIWEELKVTAIHRGYSMLTNVYGRDTFVEICAQANDEVKKEIFDSVLAMVDYSKEKEAAASNKYADAAAHKKKFHALDFLREEEPEKSDLMVHSLGHRSIRQLVDEFDVFADMLYKKIEHKIPEYAPAKGSAFVIVALARKERYRKKIYEAIKGLRAQLGADKKNSGADILARFVDNPSDPSVFTKEPHAPKQAAKPADAKEQTPKPVAVVPKEKDIDQKGTATPTSTPGKKTPQKGKDEPKQGTKSVVKSPKAFTGPGSATKKSPKQQQKK